MRNAEVERVAETHFFIRPTLLRALKSCVLTAEGQAAASVEATNYLEYWQGTYADRWFDMSTLVRLGTGVETGLRDYHHLVDPAAVSSKTGFYQRLSDASEAGLVAALAKSCAGDVTAHPGWTNLVELMVHRHLYAHRAGGVDTKYVDGLKAATGQDISEELSRHGYPEEHIYWFEPLKQLTEFINAARQFFASLPDPPGLERPGIAGSAR